MNREEVWKNFDLSQEIEIAGNFMYNGLRCFHEMRTLDRTEEIFDFLYHTAVGLERLLKVAVILLEHRGIHDQEDFEKSLITHNHLELLNRIRGHRTLNLGNPHTEFLAFLLTFYKSLRYDRYHLSLVWNPDKERDGLRRFLTKHLAVTLDDHDGMTAIENTERYKTFIGGIVGKIATQVYDVIVDAGSDLNLYLYERRVDSKASKLFLRKAFTFRDEDVLIKELLIYFVNAKDDSALLRHIRGIDPLEFDPALAQDYLSCLFSEEARQETLDQLDALYDDVPDVKSRLQQLEPLGNSHFIFWDDFEEDDL